MGEKAMAIKNTLKTTVNDFRGRALTRSYDIGKSNTSLKVRNIGLMTIAAISGPSLAGMLGVTFAAARTADAVSERAVIGKIAELAKQPGGLTELQQEMRTLDVAQQERLASKLTDRGIAVRDIGLTVKSYKELFAQPNFWSLGAGRQIVNKVWLSAAWGAGLAPVVVETATLADGLIFSALLTGVMFGAAKIWGTIRENSQVKKLAALIKNEADKAVLKQALQDAGYSAELQARLLAKLQSKGVNI
jgi:hypothetical protein